MVQHLRVFSTAYRMRAVNVFCRFRATFVFRPMIVHMRMCMRMTVDHVAVAVLMIVGMGVEMLML